MPSSAAESVPARQPGTGTAPALVLALALSLGLSGTLVGCSADEDAAPPGVVASSSAPVGTSGGTTSGSSSAVGRTTRPRLPVPPDVVQGIRDALAERARALRGRDPAGFGAGVAPADDAFVAHQQTYYANLAQLPLAALDYSFDPRSMVRTGDDYWLTVEVRLQLDGFDTEPVVAQDRYRYTPGPGPGEFLLASVTNQAWERARDVREEPWDAGPVVVRRAPGVLGVFDAASAPYADALLPTVSQGIGEVAARVPYDWTRSVVLYALSDTGYLAAIPDLPGGDPERLDGVAFPVFSRVGGGELASTRFVLHPRLLTRPGRDRERLVRHELTHVALGERDDRAPVWLGEGLAEYVSVRALAPHDRRVSEAAVASATDGVHDLPADEAFNGDKSRANYGLAWWVCEYLADTYGEPVLWRLLDALAPAPGGATPELGPALHELTGLNTRQLARKGAKLLVRTYAPPEPEETDTASPSSEPGDGTDGGPSGDPSDDASGPSRSGGASGGDPGPTNGTLPTP